MAPKCRSHCEELVGQPCMVYHAIFLILVSPQDVREMLEVKVLDF